VIEPDLVMPTRHLLAKELSTLQALSNVILVGTGWARIRGRMHSQARARTDEAVELVAAPHGRTRSYEGRFAQLHDVEIGPPMTARLPIWVAGGRQLPHAASPERPVMAPAVLRRIANAEGWIARPTSLPSQIGQDLAEIRTALHERGRDPGTFTVAHENFLHLVATEDPAEAEREQRRAFTAVMVGQAVRVLPAGLPDGTLREILAKIDDRIAAGAQC
jgi:hypothetical protein